MPLLLDEIKPNNTPIPAKAMMNQLVQPSKGMKPIIAKTRAMSPMSIESKLAITVL